MSVQMPKTRLLLCLQNVMSTFSWEFHIPWLTTRMHSIFYRNQTRTKYYSGFRGCMRLVCRWMPLVSINLLITICFERKYHRITHTNQTSGRGTNGKKAEMHWLTIVQAENAQNYCQQENCSATYAEKFVEMVSENMQFLEISTARQYWAVNARNRRLIYGAWP